MGDVIPHAAIHDSLSLPPFTASLPRPPSIKGIIENYCAATRAEDKRPESRYSSSPCRVVCSEEARSSLDGHPGTHSPETVSLSAIWRLVANYVPLVLCFRRHEVLLALNRWLLLAAVVGNSLVVGLSFAVFGWNTEGAGVATRSTARFAIAFFLLGLAAPGLKRWMRWVPEPFALIQAFVAAQMIHFGCVALLHTRFAPGRFHLSAGEAVVTIVGFSIVVAVGAMAVPHPGHRFYGFAHIFTLYVLFLFLAADYREHPVRVLRLMLVPVLVAMLLRHLPRRREKSLGANANS
jgi:hypothetical protein